MKHLKTFNQQTNEGFKELAIGAMMAMTPLVTKSQEWVQRAANANLYRWEKCRLSTSPSRSGSVGQYKVKSYKNEYDRISSSKGLYKSELKELENSCPEDVDIDDWIALNHESKRVSAYLGDTNYDKFVDENGQLIDTDKIKDDKEREIMVDAIKLLDPWFVYYKKIFPKSRRVTALDLLNYYKGLEGGLGYFKKLLNSGYKIENEDDK